MGISIFGYFLRIIIFILPVLSLVTSTTVLIKSIIDYKKTGNSVKLKYNILTIGCTVIAIVSWLFNIGLFRFCMIFTGLPFIHSMLFVVSNSLSANHIEEYDSVKKNVISSYVTYLAAHVLLPDAGDYGGMYVFFGLIQNSIVSLLCCGIAVLATIGNICYIIFQFSDIKAIKKTMVE